MGITEDAEKAKTNATQKMVVKKRISLNLDSFNVYLGMTHSYRIQKEINIILAKN